MTMIGNLYPQSTLRTDRMAEDLRAEGGLLGPEKVGEGSREITSRFPPNYRV